MVLILYWAADPEYCTIPYEMEGGPTLHFFTKTMKYKETWEKVQPLTEKQCSF
jgi:hypothetical protein